MEDENKKPVCYISHTLYHAERNYAHIEKEMMVLIFAVKKFH